MGTERQEPPRQKRPVWVFPLIVAGFIVLGVASVAVNDLPDYGHDAGTTEVASPTSPPGEKLPASDIVVDVTAIVARRPEAVEEVLGAGACEVEGDGTRCAYRGGTVEVLFVDGLADWITLQDMSDATFSTEALQYLGLTPTQPTLGNEHVLRWSNIEGLHQVAIFPGQPGVSHAYVLATPR